MKVAHSSNNIERRFISGGMEVRKSDSAKGYTLRGYAFRFGSVYDMGDFTEEVERSGFAAADMSDVRILDNHLSDKILGRTKSGTARVGIDETGGWYEVDLPDSPNGHNIRASVERGDIDQSSWGFTLSDKGDTWERRNGKLHRKLVGVSAWLDASPVTFPANPDTTIAKRSMEAAKIETRDDDSSEGPLMDDATGNTPAVKSELSYMLDNVAWATYRDNDMVYALNNWIDNYKYFAESNTDVAPVFQALIAQCEAAKAAIVAMIDGHADAIKALNGHPNRSTENQEKVKSKALDDADFRLRQMQLSQ